MDIRAISLFSGAGGFDIAARWAGIRTVAYCEIDPYAQAVLSARMRDGQLDPGPIWNDVRTFEGAPWRRRVDIIYGGPPCQDVSVAGRREGIGGARSGLVREFLRLVREVGPGHVLIENVPGFLVYGGIGVVLGWLAALGYDAEWSVRSAADVGAPHLRARVWIIGYRREPAQGGLSYAERDAVRFQWERDGEQQGEPRTPKSGYDGKEKSMADSECERRAIARSAISAEEEGGWSLNRIKRFGSVPEEKESICDAERGRRRRKSRGGGQGRSLSTDMANHKAETGNSGQLNPTWVEWLMGWPLGWTALPVLEMEWFLSVRSRTSKKSSKISKGE